MIENFVHRPDLAALTADPTVRSAERLVGPGPDPTTGVAVSMIVTPPGGGSPEGLHTHVFDQVFVLLGGQMDIELAGEHTVLKAGDIVHFPAGQPHRNSNPGTRPSVHLSIVAPPPRRGEPFATPVRVAKGATA